MPDIARIKALYSAARQIDAPGERSAFLDRSCGTDLTLRQSIEDLLSARQNAAGGFLEHTPVLEVSTLGPFISSNPAVELGARIGPYELISVLGEGGMGTVYRARQVEPIKRDVALKVVKQGMASANVVARFEAERQALALMDHPNIARVFDAGTTPHGQPYFVMELVNGSPLTKYCAEMNLSACERLKLFIQVCRAIQHAHQKGIIHRDIKPSNILVAHADAHAVPKVIDFGVAKALGEKLTVDTMNTQTGLIMGTLDYMAPEQAGSSEAAVDARTDVYALGAVLYELLTGVTPFASGNKSSLFEKLRIIREVEPPRPSTRLSETPHALSERDVRGELDWIVLKALDKNPARRYQSADGFVQDVERHLNGEPVSASPDSGMYRFKKFIGRNKIASLAACALAAALIAGLCAALWQADRAVVAERIAESKTEAAQAAQKVSDRALADLKRTAPTFYALAKALRDEGKFNEAIEKLGYALQLDPDDAESHLLKAHLLQSSQKLAPAIEEFRRVLALRPSDESAQSNLDLSDSLMRESNGATGLPRSAQLKLLTALRAQQRMLEAAPLSALLEPDIALAETALRARLRAYIKQEGWRQDRVTRLADGTFSVDLKDLRLTDFSELKGQPVSVLRLDNGKILKETFLAGMPLASLSMKGCDVYERELNGLKLQKLDVSNSEFQNVWALSEMPLERLDLSSTRASELKPLPETLIYLNLGGSRVGNLAEAARFKKLQYLNVSRTPVNSLVPLRKLSLIELDCSYTRVADLTPLNGHSLLRLNVCGILAKDFGPLCSLKQLEELVVAADSELPAELRRASSLKAIALYDIRHKQTPEEFWKDYDQRKRVEAAKAVLWERIAEHRKSPLWVDSRLGEMPDGTFNLNLIKLGRGTLEELKGMPISQVNLGYTDLSDISVLAGLPLTEVMLASLPNLKDLSPLRGLKLKFVGLNRSKNISDLSPLAGMKLTGIDLLGTSVADLSPLRGMPLESLKISHTNVVDLAPIAGMPLTSLVMDNCKAIDFTPLATLPKLTWLQVEGSLALKDLTPLKGLKLEVLLCNNCPISDVSLLRGQPIHRLDLGRTKVEDLSPLLDCPALESLIFPSSAKNIELLRKLPRLTAIGVDEVKWLKPAVEFWKDLDTPAKQPDKF